MNVNNMRYLLLLLPLTLLAQIPGTFRVTGPVAPTATNSNYGASIPVYNYGGLLTGLGSLSELQNLNIYPLARRHAGQMAVLTNGVAYQLGSDLTTWTTYAGWTNFQTVNNFTVKTNLTVGNTIVSTNEAVFDGVNIGQGAGNAAGSTRVGKNAMNGSATGTGNTAIGEQAGLSLTTGISNTLIGNNAAPFLTSSGANVVVGKDALFYATFGDTVPGTFGYTNGTHNNIVLGVNAYYNLIKGRNNFAAGTFAGYNVTNGSFNVLLGTHSMNDLILGDSNTALGESTLWKNQTGDRNTAVGHQAGYYSTGDSGDNVYLGYNAGPTSLTTEYNKLYINNASGDPLIFGEFAPVPYLKFKGRVGIGGLPTVGTALQSTDLGQWININPATADGQIHVLNTGTAYSTMGYNGTTNVNAWGAASGVSYYGNAQAKPIEFVDGSWRMRIIGTATNTYVNINVLPTSPTGLTSGVLWSDSGTIKAAPATNTSSIGNFVVSTSGRGVDFSATANGSGTMTSELLTDYEEGTWNPQYTNLTPPTTPYTMDVLSAQYVKVGKKVTVNAWIRTSSVNTAGAAGALRISGLPYAAAVYPNGYAAISIAVARTWGGDYPSGGYVVGGSQVITLEYRTTSNGATTDMDSGDLSTSASGNTLVFTATYFTD